MNNIIENLGKDSKRLIQGFDVEDIMFVSSTLSRCTFKGQDGLLKFEVMHKTNPLYAVLMALAFASVDAGLPLHAFDIFPLRTATRKHGIVLALLFTIPKGKSLSLDHDLSQTSDLMTTRELVASVYAYLTLMCDENLNPNTMQPSSYAFLRDDESNDLSMVLLDSCKAQTQKQCSQGNLNELKRTFSTRLPQASSNMFAKMMRNVSSTVKQSPSVPTLQEQTDYVEQHFEDLPKPLQPINYV
jgi:hypothetical protein